MNAEKVPSGTVRPFIDNKGAVRTYFSQIESHWDNKTTSYDDLNLAIIGWIGSRLPGSSEKRSRALIYAGQLISLASREQITDPAWFFQLMDHEIDRINTV